jgi:flagellar hook protein FlgE
MLPVMHTARAGIQSAQRGLDVVANNVANVNTDGYRAQRYDPASGEVRPRHDPLPPVPEDADAPPSDVDLAEEFIDLKRYEVGVRAGIKVIEVADNMLGRLLDIFDDRES